MSGKPGMKQYPAITKAKVREEHRSGRSVRELSREYGISRYAIQTWCGLVKEKEITVEPKRRGRPRKTPIPPLRQMELRIKELERENELLRSFLHAAGRR